MAFWISGSIASNRDESDAVGGAGLTIGWRACGAQAAKASRRIRYFATRRDYTGRVNETGQDVLSVLALESEARGV